MSTPESHNPNWGIQPYSYEQPGVALEDIFDRYHGGHGTPQAFNAQLSNGRTNARSLESFLSNSGKGDSDEIAQFEEAKRLGEAVPQHVAESVGRLRNRYAHIGVAYEYPTHLDSQGVRMSGIAVVMTNGYDALKMRGIYSRRQAMEKTQLIAPVAAPLAPPANRMAGKRIVPALPSFNLMNSIRVHKRRWAAGAVATVVLGLGAFELAESGAEHATPAISSTQSASTATPSSR